MNFQSLIQAWQLTPSLHTFNAPASNQDLQQVETELDLRLPPSLRELYLFSNGMNLFHGEINISPLFSISGNIKLKNDTENCRKWFHIPSEILVFGNNGGDEHYGVWTAETHSKIFRNPIIIIGELYNDPASMSIMATNLLTFLYSTTAFYSLLWEAGDEGLNLIGLPKTLQQVNFQELRSEHFAKITQWIDPSLPDPYPDPYQKGLDSQQVRSLLSE